MDAISSVLLRKIGCEGEHSIGFFPLDFLITCSGTATGRSKRP